MPDYSMVRFGISQAGQFRPRYEIIFRGPSAILQLCSHSWRKVSCPVFLYLHDEYEAFTCCKVYQYLNTEQLRYKLGILRRQSCNGTDVVSFYYFSSRYGIVGLPRYRMKTGTMENRSPRSWCVFFDEDN